MKDKHLEDIATSISLKHGWSPERALQAKERVKHKTKMQLAYERARVEAEKLFKEPRIVDRTDR